MKAEEPPEVMTISWLRQYCESMKHRSAEDLEVGVQVKMPRSKKRRIRNKWRKNLRNYVVDTPEIKIPL
jgi:hypothetical protein